MEYSGPEPADFANVAALNGDYLRLLASTRDPRRRLAPAPIAESIRRLRRPQAARLAAAPFLLFSLRERDAVYWEVILRERPVADLFARPADPVNDSASLIAASMGFLWELAKRNPFAARLVCCASLHWCEQIAEKTFCQLLAQVRAAPDLLTLRLGNDEKLWSKLLADGISPDRKLRDAAHLTALQYVLTKSDTPVVKRWPVAARSADSPGLRIADDS